MYGGRGVSSINVKQKCKSHTTETQPQHGSERQWMLTMKQTELLTVVM